MIGGLGASLYLPAMQSLIHGNFEGKARAAVFALVGAAGAIAAAIGPLIGGFVTTVLSWRVGFAIEALIIASVLVGSRRIRDVPYTGDRAVDVVEATRGGGGLNVVFNACRELRPCRNVDLVQDVYDRVMTLMTA